MSFSFAFLPQSVNAVAHGDTEVRVLGLGLVERTKNASKPGGEPPPDEVPPLGQDYRATWVCVRRDGNGTAFLVENEDLAFYSG